MRPQPVIATQHLNSVRTQPSSGSSVHYVLLLDFTRSLPLNNLQVASWEKGACRIPTNFSLIFQVVSFQVAV